LNSDRENHPFAKSEIRSTKSEINRNDENPNVQNPSQEVSVIRISDFAFVSDFAFRASNFFPKTINLFLRDP